MKSAIILLLVLMVIAISFCHAATTWTGGGDGQNWFDSANWDSGVPGAGQDAVINSGSVLLTNATAALNSLAMGGGTLTFSNWDTKLSALNVTIQSGATMTHVTNSATATNVFGEWPTDGRVWIVCTNFDLRAGGLIDGKGRGFMGGVYAVTTNGCGPGGGVAYAGGSHGGVGGGRYNFHTGPDPYGFTNAPLQPGSGGGASKGGVGGAGGGAIRIDAGNGGVTINGIVDADAGTRTGNGAGGSGGSIYITCRAFTGTTNGFLSSKGTDGVYGASGAGAGGRIAVIYDPGDQPDHHCSVRFDASGNLTGFQKGGDGTCYFPGNALLTSSLFNFHGVRIYGVTNWSTDNLCMTNRNVVFSESRFVLTVTNSLVLNNSSLQIGSGFDGVEGAPGYAQIACKNLYCTNQSSLYVYAGPTNDVTKDFGARVTVGYDMSIASNCWIYPVSCGTNGGSVLFSVANIIIDAGGGFNADGLGYEGGNNDHPVGYGPGGGGAQNEGTGAGGGGGGYGGKGGPARYGILGGVVCGYTNAPVFPGSGGGRGLKVGRAGGGLVWIKASETVTLNGTIRADGAGWPGANYVASGAGGGILVVAGRKLITGPDTLLKADGQSSGDGIYSGGAGGGGRIAVWYYISEVEQAMILADPANAQANVSRIIITNDLAGFGFQGTVSVTNGTGCYPGEPGTFVILTVPPARGLIFMGF